VCERFGPEKGTVLMRKYACCYAQGRPGAREFRTRVAHCAAPAEFRKIVEACFPRGASEKKTAYLLPSETHY